MIVPPPPPPSPAFSIGFRPTKARVSETSDSDPRTDGCPEDHDEWKEEYNYCPWCGVSLNRLQGVTYINEDVDG